MTLTEAERSYFIKKLGGIQPASKPLNQLKIEFYRSQTGATSKNLQLLERLWLLSVVGESSDINFSNLWKEAVVKIGQTPTNFINQNRLTYYLNAN
jgi:hypothetical protein